MTRRIVSKKSAEMNHVLVDQEKNINNVMEIKYSEVIFKYFLF